MADGTEKKKSKKRLMIPLLIVALSLIAAGYVVFYTGGSDVIPPLGNVRADLTGTEYETPSEPLVPREEIAVRPTVTNTGDVSIYTFLAVTIPYSTVDGEIVEWYDLDPDSSWTQIDRAVAESEVTYVFAYETSRDDLIKLEPGQNTDSLFNDDHRLTVGAIGLLEESDRTDANRSKIGFNYHVCQCKMMDGLTDTQVFEAILEEER